MADYFEESTKTEEYKKLPPDKAAKEVSNWLVGEASRIMNANSIDIDEFRKTVGPEQLLKLIASAHNVINVAMAKTVLEEMFQTGKDADEIITRQGLSQISDTSEIENAVIEVVKSNVQAVSDFRSGKEAALKFLVGQVMKATKGRANPALVNEVLKKELAEGANTVEEG